MKIKYIVSAMAILAMTSCLKDGTDTILLNGPVTENGSGNGGNGGNPDDPDNPDNPNTPPDLDIPKDEDTDPNPPVVDSNTDIPNTPAITDTKNGYSYITLTGIYDPFSESWIKLHGTGKKDQNVWLSIDGTPKSVDAINVSEIYPLTFDEKYTVKHDVVFLFNSSVSMNEEIDAVADEMQKWIKYLTDNGADLRVGCVGYDEGETSINGAIDLTSGDKFMEYLDRTTGAGRARGYSGDNAQKLRAKASDNEYNIGYNCECAVIALRFANDLFTFRPEANRVYINFTDEPNQPDDLAINSVEYLDPVSGKWSAEMGTVHSIYNSSNISYDEVRHLIEYPWRMAEYTGGTKDFFDEYFTGGSLMKLKVTEAIKHSYILRFRSAPEYLDGKKHKTEITVVEGKVESYKSMMHTFVK